MRGEAKLRKVRAGRELEVAHRLHQLLGLAVPTVGDSRHWLDQGGIFCVS